MALSVVRIVPVAHPVLAPDGTKPPRLSWRAEIHRDGRLIGERTITDPFTQKDHDECTWYLESHVRTDPFDPGRADRAASGLKRYARDLARDLNLDLKNGSAVELVVGDNLPADQDSKSTIHRLHWELLEDLQAWGIESLDLRVRRSVSMSPSTNNAPANPRWTTTTEPRVINILHVVARDRNFEIDKPTDISPYMALSVLIRISRELQRRGLPLRLNITTIRPGTFRALTDHLDKLESEGNERPYHVAHLDLHGEANEAGGAKLFFETASGSIKGRSTAKVAQALSRFGIPFVVLNACRSARADLGHAANTAAVLSLHGGAENVLAMSFETLSTAAELFLRTFYTEFLLRGATFGRAAQRGRAALRQNKIRPGVFDRRLPLSDWFFPVTYSSAGDLAVAEPVDGLGSDITWESGPVERGLDIGRLERILGDKRKAFLHGHAWIGKTTFLQYARDIWTETAFAEEVLYVDLASSSAPVRDGRSLTAILRSQVLDQALDGCNGEDIDALLHHVADEARVLVIIDGLHALSTAYPSLVPSSIQGEDANEIRTYLKRIVDACKLGKKKSMVLFCGRRAPCKPDKHSRQPQPLAGYDAWLHNMFRSSESIMGLEGLSLNDSLELCGDVIHRAGAPSPRILQPGVRDELELLCRLLLGIPSAISSFILVAETGGTPWRSLRDQLLTGESPIYRILSGALDAHPVFKEFRHLPGVLSPERLGVLLLLGLFWHQGPYDSRLADGMVRFGVCCGRANVDAVLDFASERGYIRLAALQDSRRISFVHPIFTVYCRTVLEELLRCTLAPDSGLDSRGLSSLAPSLSNINLTPGSGDALDAAMRVYSNLTSPRMHGAYDKPGALQTVTWFLENVDYQLAYQIKLPDDATKTSTAFKIQRDNSANHFVNTLSCFRLCLDTERNLEPESWPLDHFVKIPSLVMSAGTSAEASLFAERYEALMSRLLQLKPDGFDSCPPLAGWFVASTVSLGLLRKSHASVDGGKQWVDFVDQALRLCNFPNPQSDYQAMAIPALQALRLQTAGGPSLAQVLQSFQAARAIRFHDAENIPSLDSIARGLSQGAEEARVARAYITGRTGLPPILQSVRELTIPTDDFLALGSFTEPGKTQEPSQAGPSTRDMSERESEALANVQSWLHDQGRQASKPRTGVHMFLPRYLSSFFDGEGAEMPSSKQDLLRLAESAMGRGDWSFLAQVHQGMLRQCLQDGDMRQANEHLGQLIQILKTNPTADTNGVTEQLELAHKLVALTVTALGVAAADRGRPDDVADVGPAIDKIEQIIRAMPDEEARTPYVRTLETLRTMQKRGVSARLDAHDWAQARADFAGLKLPTMGGPEGIMDLEAIKRHQNTGRTARELLDAVEEAMRRRQPEEGLAKLDQLEHLCREEPVALFIVAGGHESMMKMREMLLDLAGAQRWRRALITLAVELLIPFIVAGLSWAWSKLWG
jgi:hypothetical protein